jgi:hypothetical protein
MVARPVRTIKGDRNLAQLFVVDLRESSESGEVIAALVPSSSSKEEQLSSYP